MTGWSFDANPDGAVIESDKVISFVYHSAGRLGQSKSLLIICIKESYRTVGFIISCVTNALLVICYLHHAYRAAYPYHCIRTKHTCIMKHTSVTTTAEVVQQLAHQPKTEMRGSLAIMLKDQLEGGRYAPPHHYKEDYREKLEVRPCCASFGWLSYSTD